MELYKFRPHKINFYFLRPACTPPGPPAPLIYLMVGLNKCRQPPNPCFKSKKEAARTPLRQKKTFSRPLNSKIELKRFWRTPIFTAQIKNTFPPHLTQNVKKKSLIAAHP